MRTDEGLELREHLEGAWDLAVLSWRARRRTPFAATSARERLANLPTHVPSLDGPVETRWSGRQVPFVAARSQRDAALGLGVAHAHLRLFQIDVMRRLAAGRLAEIFGAAALPVDRLTRIVGFTRAVPAIEAELDEATRCWLEGFVDGLNAVTLHAAPPPEYGILGERPQAWCVGDVLAIGRLAASDFSWQVWRQLAPLVRHPRWPEIWQRLMAGDEGGAGLVDLMDRGGSNAAAVGGARSASGHALLAADPHLQPAVPNLFLAAGVRAPGLEAVGLMVPGLPVFGVGRNRDIAWGGTSLHAASSDLVDVAGEPAVERHEVIAVRGRRAAACTVRDTTFGPIVSDARLLGLDRRRPLALRWIGHRPNDEIRALLGVARAADWQGFKTALEGYAAPAVTMLYADRRGAVGQVTAAHLPRRGRPASAALVVSPAASDGWQTPWRSPDLPGGLAPPSAVLVSANDRPPAPIADRIGAFYAGAGRANRLRRLLDARLRITRDDLARAQTDVTAEDARDLARRFAALVPRARIAHRRAREALLAWDGVYHRASAGAVAFEAFLAAFLMATSDRGTRRTVRAAWDVHGLVARELARGAAPALRAAAARAAREADRALRRYPNWGRMHRLRLAHPFARLPGARRALRVVDRGTDGGRETLMKAAHPPTSRRHVVRKAAVARFVTDLGDVDGSGFALLGGQDGWPGSPAAMDQCELWQAGRLLALPLSPDGVRRGHPEVHRLCHQPRKRREP